MARRILFEMILQSIVIQNLETIGVNEPLLLAHEERAEYQQTEKQAKHASTDLHWTTDNHKRRKPVLRTLSQVLLSFAKIQIFVL